MFSVESRNFTDLVIVQPVLISLHLLQKLLPHNSCQKPLLISLLVPSFPKDPQLACWLLSFHTRSSSACLTPPVPRVCFSCTGKTSNFWTLGEFPGLPEVRLTAVSQLSQPHNLNRTQLYLASTPENSVFFSFSAETDFHRVDNAPLSPAYPPSMELADERTRRSLVSSSKPDFLARHQLRAPGWLHRPGGWD